MRIDPETDILGLIDIQATFMPGGELPVAQGDSIVPVVNQLLGRFGHAFATQDWHPAGHASFASTHPGRQPYDTITLPYGTQVLWPDHGVAGTSNATIHPAIDQSRVEVIIRKGFRPTLDSYSAFFENDRTTPTGLEAWLRQRGFRRIFFCGLATDFCVAWSAEDAARLGFAAVVIRDACRGIGLPTADGRTTIEETQDRLIAQGVKFIESGALTPI
ncbi:MAG TPA: bifunctional nicotinamidase/pyrazinamidase [Rhodopila sp.]|nr:bifunctional nicotinamidase/pyrazinamidase [Rhodopila sp.]